MRGTDISTMLLGPVAAILVGIALANVVALGVTRLIDVPYRFNPGMNLVSFFFSALIGVVFGYFPARRAAQLDPIEALRYE